MFVAHYTKGRGTERREPIYTNASTEQLWYMEAVKTGQNRRRPDEKPYGKLTP